MIMFLLCWSLGCRTGRPEMEQKNAQFNVKK